MDLTKPNNHAITVNKEITESQEDFLNVCRELQWGKLEVLVQNGEPVYSRLLEKTYQHKKIKH